MVARDVDGDGIQPRFERARVPVLRDAPAGAHEKRETGEGQKDETLRQAQPG
jgi:hypothetical protein